MDDMTNHMDYLILFKVALYLKELYAKRHAQHQYDPNRQEALVHDSIQATGLLLKDEFPNVEENLRAWVENNGLTGFASWIVERKVEGITPDDLDSFLSTSGFYLATAKKQAAARVLKIFFDELYKRIMASPETSSLIIEQQIISHEHNEQDRHIEVMTAISRIVSLPPEDKRLPDSNQGGFQSVSIDQLEIRMASAATRAQLQLVKSLMGSLKFRTALDILTQVLEEADRDRIEPELLYKMYANIGLCKLVQGDPIGAKSELIRALALKPGDAKALSNVALAHFASREFQQAEKYAREGLAADETQTHSLAVLVKTLGEQRKREEIEALCLKYPVVSVDRECLLELAGAYERCEQYETSLATFRQCLRLNSDDVDANLGLGLLVAQRLGSTRGKAFLLPTTLIASEQELALAAIDSLSKAINRLQKTEFDDLMAVAIVNRGVLFGLLEDFNSAAADFDNVLRNPLRAVALYNKGLLCLKYKKYELAKDCFLTILEKDDREDILILLAIVYIESGSYSEAKSLLEPKWNDIKQGKWGEECADLLIKCMQKEGREWRGTEYVKLLQARATNSPIAKCILATAFAFEGQLDQARTLLEQARSELGEQERDQATYILANVCEQSGDIDKAQSMIEEILEHRPSQDLQLKLLSMLYSHRRYKETLEISRRIRCGGPCVPRVSDFEGLVLAYQSGDLDGAMRVFSELSTMEPTITKYRIIRAELHFRKGQTDQSKALVENIGIEEVAHDVESLLHIAQLRTNLRLPGAVPLAYRARQLMPSDERTNFAFLSFVHAAVSSEDALCEPAVVEMGVVAVVKTEDSTTSYFLSDDQEELPDVVRLDSSSKLCEKLLGIKVGELARVRNTDFDESNQQVVAIQTKYVHLCRYLMSHFTELFPETTNLYKIRLKSGDADEIFGILDERQERINEVMGLYRRKQITAGTVAGALGQSVIDVLVSQIHSPSGVILAAHGSDSEAHLYRTAMHSAKQVVVDSTALLAVVALNLENEVASLGKELVISSATVDGIRDLLTQVSILGNKVSFSLSKEGDEYVKWPMTADLANDRVQFLNRMLVFVKEHIRVESYEGVLDIPNEEYKNLLRGLGRDAITSVLISQDLGAILWSDDLALREIAFDGWKVKGCWTQTVLEILQTEGHMSEGTYNAAVLKLALGNYWLVRISASTFIQYLRHTSFAITANFLKLMKLLNSNNCDKDAAISVCSTLTREIVLEPLMKHQTEFLLDVVMSTLVSVGFPSWSSRFT